jgi:hypothetical protein
MEVGVVGRDGGLGDIDHEAGILKNGGGSRDLGTKEIRNRHRRQAAGDDDEDGVANLHL